MFVRVSVPNSASASANTGDSFMVSFEENSVSSKISQTIIGLNEIASAKMCLLELECTFDLFTSIDKVL